MQRIKALAEQKQKDIEKLQYDKYHHLYDIAFEVLSKENVLLYGGVALNELMPESLKFYDKHVLADIDVFAMDAKKVAQCLVKEYKRLGYSFPMYREALHANTYKIFVEGLQVADVSHVSKSVFNKLSTGGIDTSFGIKTVSTRFLQLSLHTLLSQPYDAYRWSKVYQRLVNFYKIAPNPTCIHGDKSKTSVPEIPLHIVDQFERWVADNHYITFGQDVLQEYMPKLKHHGNTINDILVAQDIGDAARTFVSSVNDRDLSVSVVYKGDMIVPEHVFVTYKRKNIFGLYKVNTCTSYVKYKGMRVASFHTIFNVYLSMLFSKYKHHNTDYIQCVVSAFTKLQKSLLKKSDAKKLMNQFVVDCYGPHEGKFTLKRKQLQRDK